MHCRDLSTREMKSDKLHATFETQFHSSHAKKFYFTEQLFTTRETAQTPFLTVTLN